MISDNDLLLYHYGDGLDSAERERIAAALRTQPALVERLSALVKHLDATASSLPELPVPMHVQRRWESALDRATARETNQSKRSPMAGFERFRWPAVAAALAAVIAVGLRFAGEESPPAPSQTVANVSAPAQLENGVRWHLVSTERQLDELQHVNGEQRADLIAAVIAQNRLYAAAAERAGDAKLARALRAFTPILEDLADDAGEPRADGDLAQLSFELRVMQARLATPPDNSGNARSIAL